MTGQVEGDRPITAPDAALAALEARLGKVLEPYLNRLERFEIYGVPMLRRPGARAHDWFAGIRAGAPLR
jgi:hypothetical protein